MKILNMKKIWFFIIMENFDSKNLIIAQQYNIRI